jgi:hypothetical protein
MLDFEVWEIAQNMIEVHGPLASWRASLRAKYLIRLGDVDGCAAWKRVLKAIEAIQGTQSSGPARRILSA